MEEKIMKPRSLIYEMIGLFSLFTYMFGFIIFLALVFEDMYFVFFSASTMLGMWIFIIVSTFQMYQKNEIRVINGKVIIVQKIQEWENTGRTVPKGSWIHQRMEVDPAEVFRIGCSYDLYGNYLYYHAARTRLGVYNEVTIEMKDGRKVTFDPYIYAPKQRREIIKILSHNGNIQITGYLKKILGKRFLNEK